MPNTARLLMSVFGACAIVLSPLQQANAQTSAASTPKEIRKAERKAARTRNHEELSTLKKNGYDPDDESSYPNNLQHAEKKADAASASSTSGPTFKGK